MSKLIMERNFNKNRMFFTFHRVGILVLWTFPSSTLTSRRPDVVTLALQPVQLEDSPGFFYPPKNIPMHIHSKNKNVNVIVDHYADYT